MAKRVAEGQASGGLSFPPPDASVFGLSGADRDWVNRRQTPQPFGIYQEPLQFDPAVVLFPRISLFYLLVLFLVVMANIQQNNNIRRKKFHLRMSAPFDAPNVHRQFLIWR